MNIVEDVLFGVGGYLIGKNTKNEKNSDTSSINEFVKNTSIEQFVKMKFINGSESTTDIRNELLRIANNY